MSKHKPYGGNSEKGQNEGAQAPFSNGGTSPPSEEDADGCGVGGIGQATSPKTSQGC